MKAVNETITYKNENYIITEISKMNGRAGQLMERVNKHPYTFIAKKVLNNGSLSDKNVKMFCIFKSGTVQSL